MATGTIQKVRWGTPTTFTMPFTPDRDGFCVCTLIPLTNASSHYYVKTAAGDLARGSSSGGSSYSVSFPVVAGTQYYVYSYDNIDTRVYNFFPFA